MGRTNIVIDAKLVRRVMKLLGASTIRKTVDLALHRIADQAEAYEGLRKLRGKVRWEGDIDALRRSRV